VSITKYVHFYKYIKEMYSHMNDEILTIKAYSYFCCEYERSAELYDLMVIFLLNIVDR